MYGMFISARGGGKQRAMEEYIKATLKGRDTMKTIKRRLMGGYVEFTDGTYGKEVALDRLVQLAREGLDANLTVMEDDTLYIGVHEDEASAYEPSLFFDEEDDEEWMSMVNHSRAASAMAEFYDMYSDEPLSPLMLTDKIVNAGLILEHIWSADESMYEDAMSSLREDMARDMQTLLATMDVVHDDRVKDIFDTYTMVWEELNFMDKEG